MSFFFKWSNVKVKRLSTNSKILSQAIFMWNIKALALTIEILLTGSKYSKCRPEDQGHKVKNVGTHRKVLILKILMWNIKALAHTIQMLLKFSKSRSNSKVKVTIVGTQVKHQSSRSHCSKVIRKLNVFIKVGQTPGSQGQNGWYPLKGLVT